MSGKRAKARGFTLVELLVVLTITALAISVIPPMVSRSLPAMEVRAAARSLANELRQARLEAMQEGHAVLVMMNLEETRLPASIELEVASTHAGPISGGIEFFPDGSSTGGSVRLTWGNRLTVVDVDWMTGRVSLNAR